MTSTAPAPSPSLKISPLWYFWTVAICLPTWISWAAGFSWVFELFVHFKAQYAVGLALGIIPLAWKRHGGLVAIVALTLSVNLVGIVPLYFADTPLPPKGTQIHKVMLANVHSSNTNYRLLKQLIAKEKPDIIVLLEISQGWAKALQPLHAKYPQQMVIPRPGNFGIAFLSRHPARQLQRLHFGPGKVPSVVAQIQFGTQWIWLLGTHPMPPMDALMTRDRDLHLTRAGAYLGGLAAPKMLLGDLNATSWSPSFGRLLRGSRLRDSRSGFGLQPTWQRDTVAFALPIDHILVSEQIHIHRRWVGPDIGSDHRPVLMTFSIQTSHSAQLPQGRKAP